MGYRNYSTALGHIVDPNGKGDFKTITAALTAASSGQTIFIRPGTYVENFTLKAGVNLTAFSGDQFPPNVIIVGKITASYSGSATLSNLYLQTNSDYFLTLTGVNSTTLTLSNCYLTSNSNDGLNYAVSNVLSRLNIYNCKGNLAGSYKLFTFAGTGLVRIRESSFENSAGATTSSTASAGTCAFTNSSFFFPFAVSSSAVFNSEACEYNMVLINTTAVSYTGTSTGAFASCRFPTGTASAINVGSGCSLLMGDCIVQCTNAISISGSGTLTYTCLDLLDSTAGTIAPTQSKRPCYLGGVSFDGGTNVMNAYSVGTFTPTFVGNTTAGTTTYTNQNGYYIRIGDLIQVQALMTGTGATGTGAVSFRSLPFTVKNQTNGSPVGSALLSQTGWAWPAGTTSACFQATLNTTRGVIFLSGSADAGGNLQTANATFNMQYSVMFQI